MRFKTEEPVNFELGNREVAWTNCLEEQRQSWAV